MKKQTNELKTLFFVFTVLFLYFGVQTYYFKSLDKRVDAEINRANNIIKKTTDAQTELAKERDELKKINDDLNKKIKKLESIMEVMVLPTPPIEWWKQNPKKANFPRKETDE